MASITIVALIKEAVPEVKASLAPNNVELIYGTVRLIGKQTKAFCLGQRVICLLYLQPPHSPHAGGDRTLSRSVPQTHRLGSEA